VLVGGKLLLGDGETARTACAPVLVRGVTDEKTGEALPAAVVAQRAGWCAALVRDIAAGLLEEHWTAADVGALALGRDREGRPLPAQAWTALRRLGWAARVPAGITVNDRVVRMAQEQAGRLLRSADLRTLEARGMGKTMNTRLSQTVRGQIADKIRHLAAEQGIAVVTVPARGTSKYCPRCLAPLRHRKAPDQPTVPGWKWAACPGCGWQGDRDQGAWQRIAARGLTHQHQTTAGRTTGIMAVRAVDDALEPAAVITAKAPRPGPVQGRPDPETICPPRAQATRGTLPAPAPRPGRPASGGTRHNGPPAAPRSPSGPGRDHDQPHSRPPPAPGTRSGTRRRVPPQRPRHPAQTGTDPPNPRVTEDH
jgi:Putative transposase DNA-binding domain